MEIAQNKFAAFVMTYKRPMIAKETILKLFEQTVPPQKVVVIDNDEFQSGKILLEQLSHLPLIYHAMGFNSGPAGAAAKGLKLLSDEGYDWIAWIDDDDPPFFSDVFEILLVTASKHPKCGCVGVVGQFFNKQNGLIERVPNELLNDKGILKVNTISGNMLKIINSKSIILEHILPDINLFFGFEELDYDLQLQKSGYVFLVDKELFLRHRVLHNRLKLSDKKIQKTDRQLVRDYYSSRNLLYILKKNDLKRALFYTFLRIIYKTITAFRFGLGYGLENLKYQIKAIYHHTINCYGPIK